MALTKTNFEDIKSILTTNGGVVTFRERTYKDGSVEKSVDIRVNGLTNSSTSRSRNDYDFLTDYERDYLQSWTGCDDFVNIFDSNVDNWSNNNSFRNTLWERSKILIVIVDEQGNKFGGYIDKVINKIYDGSSSSRIYSNKSFVFSLDKNGIRNYIPKKYNVSTNCTSFMLYGNYAPSYLCSFGLIHIPNDYPFYSADICLTAKSKYSQCHQNSYDYRGNKDSLRRNGGFSVDRFIVYQMC